jgi:hypothetical protein
MALIFLKKLYMHFKFSYFHYVCVCETMEHTNDVSLGFDLNVCHELEVLMASCSHSCLLLCV